MSLQTDAYDVKNNGFMKRTILKSKIHRVTVTAVEKDYDGSILIDKTLLEKADILPYEMVSVWNITNGNRFSTYALEGKPDSGSIVVYGAAANLCRPLDIVIISSFAILEEKEIKDFKPKIVHVDKKNRPLEK